MKANIKFLLFLLILVGINFADSPYQVNSCMNITTSGTYQLTQNINTNSTCINISASNVILDCQGYYIQGQGDNYYGYTYGVYINNQSLVDIKNCNITNFSIGIGGIASNLTIYNNSITNNGEGIHLDSSSYVNISNSNITYNNDYGVYLASSLNNVIIYNNISDNFYVMGDWGGLIKAPGVYLDSSNNTFISNNIINNGDPGINGFSSFNNTILSNTFFNDTTAIYLSGSFGNNISNNSFSNCSNDAIYLDSSESNNINNNTMIYCYNGVALEFDSNNNIVSYNNIINVFQYDPGFGGYLQGQGFYLGSSSNNTFLYNIINNSGNGIYLSYSSNNTFSNNYLQNNSWEAIYLDSSLNNTIQNNIILNNNLGIYFYSSLNNIISNNNLLNNTWEAIYLESSFNNNISNNSITNNGQGLNLYNSSNNSFSNNYLQNNSWEAIYLNVSSNNTILSNNVVGSNTGLYIDSSYDNLIFNNFFKNNQNFDITNSSDTWNTIKQAGTNIIGGSYLGGNFWAKPDGTGYSETCDDNDKDGICDNPYSLDTNNTDYLPLTYPSGGCFDINDPGEYNLTDNITSYGGTCIVINSSNVTLNCDNHIIIGNGTSPSDGYGIFVNHVDNVTIRDCHITNFYSGIIAYGNNVTLYNNTLDTLNRTGIFYEGQEGNITKNFLTKIEAGEDDPYQDVYNTFSGDAVLEYFCDQNESLTGWDVGIVVNQSSNTIIENNEVVGNASEPAANQSGVSNHNGTEAGIVLCFTNHSSLLNNTLHYAGDNYGYILYNSYYNDVLYNYVNGSNPSGDRNTNDGIIMDHSNYNNISNNQFYSTYEWGIFLVNDSHYNYIFNNTIKYVRRQGMRIKYSNFNMIRNNLVFSTYGGFELTGIYLYNSSNNTVVGSLLINNSQGVYLDSSSYNSILNNTIINNSYGAHVHISKNNLIYNNFFNNTNNFILEDSEEGNFWNTIKQAGTNIIGGPYLGGNFWAKPDGTGYSETCDDNDKDGICDNPYSLDTNNTDYLPLTYVSSSQPPHNPHKHDLSLSYSFNCSSGLLKVIVEDKQNGEKVDDAHVSLISLSIPFSDSTYSDNDGEAIFYITKNGTDYTLKATKSGYNPAELEDLSFILCPVENESDETQNLTQNETQNESQNITLNLSLSYSFNCSSGLLKVIVEDKQNGEKVDDAHVSLISLSIPFSDSTYSDNDGEAIFYITKNGTDYTLKATKSGYNPAELEDLSFILCPVENESDETQNLTQNETQNISNEEPPLINITSPSEKVNSDKVNFEFKVIDPNAETLDCVIYLDNNTLANLTVKNNTEISYEANVAPGKHNTYVKCFNGKEEGISNVSFVVEESSLHSLQNVIVEFSSNWWLWLIILLIIIYLLTKKSKKSKRYKKQ